MGFHIAHGGDNGPLLPYEQAHAVLRGLADGVNLILLCVGKDEIVASFGGLYRLINDFFYGGRAPIALVVTRFDTPDDGWWEHNQDAITEQTDIPVHSIPHAFITMIQTGRSQSKQALEALLANYAATVTPISLRLDLSSSKAASLRFASHSGLSTRKAKELVEQFSRPYRPFNIVFFGETGAGMSSVINLIAGHSVADVGAGAKTCTLASHPYKISTGIQQFLIWDTMGLNGASSMCDTVDMGGRATKNAVRLIHDLSEKGGADLLVFCKRSGGLTESEMNCYRLFKEFLCEGQVPVAVVVTHLEHETCMEEWWMKNDLCLRNFLGDVVGHACITSLTSGHLFREKWLESRLTVQTMLENCISYRSTLARVVGGISVRSLFGKTGEVDRVRKQMTRTIKNLVDHRWLTKEEAEELIELCSGTDD